MSHTSHSIHVSHISRFAKMRDLEARLLEEREEKAALAGVRMGSNLFWAYPAGAAGPCVKC